MEDKMKFTPYYPKNLSGKTVVVGLSGGVDSSVTAAILKEQGANVIGLFMKNWEELDERGVCKSSIEFKDVELVCEKLDIPYYSIDFVKEYQENVFSEFLAGYKAGFTPNPDILCNREIKFNVFFKHAMDLGADYLATGHYCQISKDEDGDYILLKGEDSNKDQSYFLGAITGEVLSKVLFPIGNIEKPKVREIAAKYDLATKEKKDSTGICFIGERNFKPFLSQYLKPNKGKFIEVDSNEVVGEHSGAQFYTIGQRKGLGLGGPGKPWFVSGKDIEKNLVYVVRGDDHPSLYCLDAVIDGFSTIGTPLSFEGRTLAVKVRYRQKDQLCEVKKLKGGELKLIFQEPQRAVTIGQSACLYFGNRCLGQGTIRRVGKNLSQL